MAAKVNNQIVVVKFNNFNGEKTVSTFAYLQQVTEKTIVVLETNKKTRKFNRLTGKARGKDKSFFDLNELAVIEDTLVTLGCKTYHSGFVVKDVEKVMPYVSFVNKVKDYFVELGFNVVDKVAEIKEFKNKTEDELREFILTARRFQREIAI